MFYLIATTKCYEGDYEAVVGEFSTEKEANEVMNCEVLAWSDEGVEYKVVAEVDPMSANCEYEFLLARVSK